MSRRANKKRKIWLLLGAGSLFLALKGRKHETPTAASSGYRNTFFWRTYDAVAQWVDQRVGWDKLPTPLGLAVLIGLRNILRQKNLYDTTDEPSNAPPVVPPYDPALLTGRTLDGTYNDLAKPSMGAVNTRFGRNVPIEATVREADDRLLSPSPRKVSRELLTRHEFIPATSVNLLAASWIQFMVKDWFNHGEGDPQHTWEIPLPSDDPWPEHPMSILKTLPDTTRPADSTDPPTFINIETHWWDGSQIYGGGTLPQDHGDLRTGKDGKLVIGDDGLLILPDDPELSPAHVPGWWLGLNMMGTVFIREHNAICDALKAEYPEWSDQELFSRARLIVSALMARIHTVEWTPAIIAHPTTVVALHANWWGVLGERFRKLFGRVSKTDEVLSGIPGSETDHYGVPYSLTEEFTIVYRMHPLTPDDFSFRSASDDAVLLEANFREIAGPHAQEVTARVPMSDLFYSFGTSHPGAICLHNFPKFLQEFERPDNGKLMDLAATDVLRAREFGVPRYNEFRRLLHLKPAKSFRDLTDNAQWASELEEVYEGDIERLDLIVGMFAEKPPAGFAFSDTAFRIFILMASRRLNSDRFFTNDFTPEIYTQLGIDWVQNTSMMDVLLRHYPELRPAMRGVTNAFQPWSPVGTAPPARA